MVLNTNEMVENDEPHRNIEQCETDDHQTHNGARTESNLQTAVQRIAGSVSCTCRSIGSGLHSEETGQAREETAGEECEPHPTVLKIEQAHHEKQHRQHNKHYDDDLVLLFKIRHGTSSDVRGDLLH